MGYKEVTIKHIAQRLKLSQSTVSNALRSDSKVKNATRKKVLKIANEMGYTLVCKDDYEKNIKEHLTTKQHFTPDKKKITIYDISKKIGVNASTVSRALNDCGEVKEATKKLIRDTANELGYSVNKDAKQLRIRESDDHASEQSPKITIYDIAAKLGISPSTVSRSFTEGSDVALSTQKNVLQMAAKLGFVFNQNARKLNSNLSQTIGLIISNFATNGVQEFIAGAEQTLKELGYGLLIANFTQENDTVIHKRIFAVCNHCDGLLIIPSFSDMGYEQINRIGEFKPSVCVGSFNAQIKLPRVTINDYKAIMDLTANLIKKGFRRILYIDSINNSIELKNRENAYIKAHNDAKIPHYQELVLNIDATSLDFDEFKKNMTGTLIPDAMIVIGDSINQNIIDALHKSPMLTHLKIAYVELEIGTINKISDEGAVKVNYNYFDAGKVSANLLIKNLVEGKVSLSKTYVNHRLSDHAKSAILVSDADYLEKIS